MEKTLKRKIGFVKPKTIKTKSATVTNKSSVVTHTVVKKDPPALSPEETKALKTKKVIAWIKSHPMFAWGRMCAILGINTGNFGQVLQVPKPYITVENLEKIETILGDYGYEK